MSDNNVEGDACASLPTYEYETLPLHQEVFSIRLLEVLPELYSGVVQCTLRTTPLDDAKQKYTCLSYVWDLPGLNRRQHCVILDGRVSVIGLNLYHLLETARELYANRPFWIDAICIDQSNVIEKSNQVQQMGRVYANAKEVIAWFGKNLELAQVFDALQERFNIYNKRKGEGRWVAPIPPIHRSNVHPVLWQDHYWTRAWITQEIVCAQHLTLQADHSRLDWDYFPKEDAFGGQSKDLGDFEQIIISPTVYRSQGLLTNLHWFGSKGCSEVSDRVYSLLALCEEHEASTITVDYVRTRSRWKLAYKVLASRPHLICLCTIRRVAQLLEIQPSQHRDIRARCPWTELALDITIQDSFFSYDSHSEESEDEESPAGIQPSHEKPNRAYSSQAAFHRVASRIDIPRPNPDGTEGFVPSEEEYRIEQQERLQRIRKAEAKKRRRQGRYESRRRQKNHQDSLREHDHTICLSNVCELFKYHLAMDGGHAGMAEPLPFFHYQCSFASSSWREQLPVTNLRNSGGVTVVSTPEGNTDTWSFTFDAILELLRYDTLESSRLCPRVLAEEASNSTMITLSSLNLNC